MDNLLNVFGVAPWRPQIPKESVTVLETDISLRTDDMRAFYFVRPPYECEYGHMHDNVDRSVDADFVIV